MSDAELVSDFLADQTTLVTAGTEGKDESAPINQVICKGLYEMGFLKEQYSDVVVTAFGKKFRLHRLILSQNPYFKALLSGPWTEANQPVITLHFDDENITVKGLEFVFARMYGHTRPFPLDFGILMSILAAACFFQDEEMATKCTNLIISRSVLSSSNVGRLLSFARDSFYGNHSNIILDAIFNYLCRDGTSDPSLQQVFYTMELDFFRTVIGSDWFVVFLTSVSLSRTRESDTSFANPFFWLASN